MTTKTTLDLLEERVLRLEELLKGPLVEYVTETNAEGNEIVVAQPIASEVSRAKLWRCNKVLCRNRASVQWLSELVTCEKHSTDA